MMIDLIYVLGVLALWPVFAVRITLSVTSRPDPEDYVFGTFFGFCAALFWPICLIFLGASKVVRHLVEAQQEANR